MKPYKGNVYECEYCGKISKVAGAMGRHEKSCRKNPINICLCWTCGHFDEVTSGNGELLFFEDRHGTECSVSFLPHTCRATGKKMYSRIGVRSKELQDLLDSKKDWCCSPSIIDGCRHYIDRREREKED